MHKYDFIAFLILILTIVAFILLGLIKKSKVENINVKMKDLLKKENFIVSDAQDFHNYEFLKDMVEHKKDNFNKDSLDSPAKDDVVNYDVENNSTDLIKIDQKKDKNGYICVNNLGWDADFPYVACSNSSIDDKFRTGETKVKPYKVSCGFPNGVTSQNFYKYSYKAQPAYLEDYAIRGANYANYTDYVHPAKSDVWILSQNTKGLPPDQTKYRNIPTGQNYAFYGSPAMRLPL
jgi:hypothetical protein